VLFRKAWKYQDQLDPRTRQDLQDKLNFLPRSNPEAIPRGTGSPAVENVPHEQQVIQQKIQQDVYRERAATKDMRDTDPRGALQRLKNLHDRVSEARVDGPFKKQLLSVIGRDIVDLERYIERNSAQIASDDVNRGRMEDVENRRMRRLDVQNELAVLVEQFNKLIDENRFAEADVLARQAYELAPEEPIVQNLMWKSRFAKRTERSLRISRDREDGFIRALGSVDASSVPFDDQEPYQFGDAQSWHDLTQTRRDRQQEMSNRKSPEELRLQHAVRSTKVDVRFANRPLREVLALLGAQAGVNIHLDERGLITEGVTSDTPVTINLTQPISLRSALHLILQDHNLSYVIQDEVIRVTSEELRDQQVSHKTYYVADLVIPIPNFVPSYNIGLPGAIAAAHNALGYGGQIPTSGSMPLTMASHRGAGATNPLTGNSRSLANVGSNSLMGTSSSRSPRPNGFGPNGAGGGPQADFDSLIELITTTIAPTTWDEVGGPGSVSGFETNLSLVVSQTQEVHEQIADLLEQLRRLQDLQVTIEVRFITVSDGFAENIGIDFDFQIDDNSSVSQTAIDNSQSRGGLDDIGPSVMFGFDGTGPTADLDLHFDTDVAAAAIVPGAPAIAGLNTGFAILSDIEVFFLLQAAQGDDRSNVMTAPKVTLFNGQQAFVSDTSQTPFVTSIIPVVGDFAAAHQPVVVVLSEGTSLSVQAVVSADRRFVRLTLVPFFSTIGDVQEFTFSGKTITRLVSDNADNGNGSTSNGAATEIVKEGTTVQLPTFNFQTVTTTVSVPDGGTVLLGGIKRLTEQRNERGVPLLSKLPYINRLFRNVGISRRTASLMMMVTPRIIIQEEEEAKAVGRVLNP
jgi:general secretion pathway protein D